MSQHRLKAQTRQQTGRQVKKLRQVGQVPANVFGKGIKSANVQVEEKTLLQLLKEVGESGLVYLQVEGEAEDRPVMIAELRRHPVSGQLQHLALHQVDLKEKTTAAVPVKLVGESSAVEEKLGILVQQLSEIELEALPADMPDHVEVDVSVLTAVGQAIYVQNVQLNAKLTIQSDPEAIVAKIEPLAAEEPKEAPVTEVTAEGAAVTPVEGEQPSSDQVPAPVVDSA